MPIAKREKSKHTTSTLIDKLVENSVLLVFSFLITAGLLGGSSYILFQLPKEEDEFERELLQLNIWSSKSDVFNEMSDLYLEGSIRTEEEGFDNLIKHLWDFESLPKPRLNIKFENEALDTIDTGIERLASERGRIAGYVLDDNILKEFQCDIVKVYDMHIDLYYQLKKVILNWDNGNPDEIAKRWKDMYKSRLDMMGTLEGMKSKLLQLKERHEIEKKQAKQKFRELETQIKIVRL